MSGRLFENDILFLQRLLSCNNLYTRKLDGLWGQHTDLAVQQFDAQCGAIAAAVATFDPRSERNIRSLRLDAQRLCRQSLAAILATGKDARVISGTRGYEEQAALFRQGRFGNKGPIVTNARAGHSWHNFGLAWDIGIFRSGAYLTDGPEYNQIATAAKVAGVEWGGDWKTFKDKPHYQTPFGASTIGAARTAFERGGRPA